MIFSCYTYMIYPYEKIMKHTVYKCDTPNSGKRPKFSQYFTWMMHVTPPPPSSLVHRSTRHSPFSSSARSARQNSPLGK